MVPLAVFVAGTALYSALRELGRLNREQAELITELRSTRNDLAAAERARGVVVERARMAGEIHDTLAQGFTSIVLLCRAARRSEDDQIDLSAIEATATDNLATARRLIEDMGPTELDAGSLTDALRREVDALPAAIDGVFRVEGSPRHLDADTENMVLRAAKELLLNVTTHSGLERSRSPCRSSARSSRSMSATTGPGSTTDMYATAGRSRAGRAGAAPSARPPARGRPDPRGR